MINPNIPAAHSPIASAELRAQFNDLQNQVTECARNPADVLPLELPVSNPPTKAEVEAVRDKVNELITTLYR